MKKIKQFLIWLGIMVDRDYYNAKSERLHTLQAERNELVDKMANAHFDWEIDKIITRINIIDLQMDNLLRN